MILYLGTPGQVKVVLDKYDLWEFYGPKNFLITFSYPLQVRFAEENWESIDNLFIDSGAFSFFNSVHQGDLDYYKTESHKQYLEDYMSWLDSPVPRHPEGKRWRDIASYANLDVIGNASATWDTQVEMERCGFSPVPVFHISDGTLDYVRRYVENGDVLAIGSAVNVHQRFGYTFPRRFSIVKEVFDTINLVRGLDTSGRMRVRVHAFGTTSLKFHRQFDYYSADSVSWLVGFGSAVVFFLAESKTVDGSPVAKQIRVRLGSRHDDDIRSFENLKPEHQELVLRKLRRRGFSIDRLRNDWQARAVVGLDYYRDLERWLTEYHDHFRERQRTPIPLF